MRIKKFFKVSIVIVLLAFTISIFYFKSSTIMFSSNIKKGISNYWKNKVSGYKKGIISNVPSEEYFINAVDGKFLGIVKAVDKNGTDKTDVFCD